jgi:ArsR family transcriptional regulator, arsenate/arsenite/antimonite-responsive transcriptional repressor
MVQIRSRDAMERRANTAEWFHALSDETRLEIVAMLTGGERCVCDLMDALDVAQSRLSFHLRVLKDAGIVSDRRDGRWVHYSLNRGRLEEMEALLHSMKPTSRARSACC